MPQTSAIGVTVGDSHYFLAKPNLSCITHVLLAKRNPASLTTLVQMSVEETLQDRGTRYGDFTTHALITQAIKDVMSGEFAQAGETQEKVGLRKVRWLQLQPMHREALEMIAHKIGRILNGDPNYADSWHDIAGYAKLVEDRISKP